MKVYVTYMKDGYGGATVEKVFASPELAIDHIISTRFALNAFYCTMSREEMTEVARKYIDEHELVGVIVP